WPGGPVGDPLAGVREGEREAQGQGRRADASDRRSKKNRRLETPAEKRRFCRDHRKQFGSIQAACRAVGLQSSTYYYQPKKATIDRAEADADLRDAIERVQAR